MSDLKATLAETLRAHRDIGWREHDDPHFPSRCPFPCGRQFQSETDHTDHVAEALLGLSGVAVTQLPDLHGQLPQALIEDAEGIVWQLRKRVYGASWYRPGDSQPHGVQDIAMPATLIRVGRLEPDDEVGE